MIVWQLGRQHKNELKLQKENYRDKLRLDIYQDFATAWEEANSTSVHAGMYAFSIPTNVKIYIDHINSGLSTAPVSDRPNELYNRHTLASEACIKLIRLIEKYEIVSPELDIFKLAITTATDDMRTSISPLFSFLLTILPMEVPDANGNLHTVNIIIPTPAQVNQLDQLVKAYKDAEDMLGAHLFDLNVELQKIFLKGLFDNKVKLRKPIDPKFKVITTDPENMKKLEKHFLEETNFGKRAAESQASVREELNIKDP